MAHASEHERKYGPPEYREWGERQPCLTAGCRTTETEWRPARRGFRECCHVVGGGTGYKASWPGTTVWACWRCHDRLDSRRSRYEAETRMVVQGRECNTLEGAAAATLEAFQSSSEAARWAARTEAGIPAAEKGDLAW